MFVEAHNAQGRFNSSLYCKFFTKQLVSWNRNDGTIHITKEKPTQRLESRAVCEQINKKTANETIMVVEQTTGWYVTSRKHFLDYLFIFRFFCHFYLEERMPELHTETFNIAPRFLSSFMPLSSLMTLYDSCINVWRSQKIQFRFIMGKYLFSDIRWQKKRTEEEKYKLPLIIFQKPRKYKNPGNK